MASNLVRRVVFAAVAIPLALLIVWYGGLPLAVAARRSPRRSGRAELFDLAERAGRSDRRGRSGSRARRPSPPLTYASLVAAATSASGRREPWPYAGGALAHRSC